MKNFISTLVVGLLFTTLLQAQTPPVDDNGLAIGGYDVVAYFSNTAIKGSTKYTAKHDGATYRFSSAENRAAFEKEPARYLPQFDGYCAWGVAAKDAKFPINPEAYDIVDGKLYLFFHGPFDGKEFNTALLWNAETTKLKAEAHEKWPEVKDN